MDIRRNRVPMRHVSMQFQFTKTPKTAVQQIKNFAQSSPVVPSLILMPSSIVVPCAEPLVTLTKIEEQVKLHQQIVAEWDNKLELMRTQEIEMRRADVVRELNTLITIWNNANP